MEAPGAMLPSRGTAAEVMRAGLLATCPVHHLGRVAQTDSPYAPIRSRRTPGSPEAAFFERQTLSGAAAALRISSVRHARGVLC